MKTNTKNEKLHEKYNNQNVFLFTRRILGQTTFLQSHQRRKLKVVILFRVATNQELNRKVARLFYLLCLLEIISRDY